MKRILHDRLIAAGSTHPDSNNPLHVAGRFFGDLRPRTDAIASTQLQVRVAEQLAATAGTALTALISRLRVNQPTWYEWVDSCQPENTRGIFLAPAPVDGGFVAALAWGTNTLIGIHPLVAFVDSSSEKDPDDSPMPAPSVLTMAFAPAIWSDGIDIPVDRRAISRATMAFCGALIVPFVHQAMSSAFHGSDVEGKAA